MTTAYEFHVRAPMIGAAHNYGLIDWIIDGQRLFNYGYRSKNKTPVDHHLEWMDFECQALYALRKVLFEHNIGLPSEASWKFMGETCADGILCVRVSLAHFDHARWNNEAVNEVRSKWPKKG